MRLLLAIDLSPGAEVVLHEAIRWVERTGAFLDLLYVDDTPSAAAFIQDPSVRDLVHKEQQRLETKHRQRVEALLDLIPEAHRGAAHLRHGNAAATIVEAAGDFDAVAVATHGRRGLAHVWLGSVAERVVRTATVPVLVLRLPESKTA